MPQFAAAWVANTFFATAGALIHTTALVTTYLATTAALGYGLSALQQDLNSRDTPGSILDVIADSDAPRQLLVGERIMAGSFAGQYVYWNGNDRKVHVIALADHQLDGCPIYYANGVPQLYDLIHGVKTEVVNYRSGGPRLWVTWYDGRPDQVADPNLVSYILANQPDWTSDHRGRGVSYAIVEMQWDDDNMMTDIQSSFLLRGGRFYDRRKDSTAGGSGSHRHKDPSTWEYTTNPDVVADHYQLGIVPYLDAPIYSWGVGLKPWQLPFAQFKAEADISDEAVLMKDGVTYQQRYAINAVFSADRSHKDILISMATAKAGRVVDRGGRLSIVGPQARSPVMTLYDGDLMQGEQTSYSPKVSISELRNTFAGRFPDPAQNFRPVEYPRITSDTWKAQDGGYELTESVEIDVDTDVERVQRIVTLHANERRRQARLTESYGPWAIEIEAGDWYERVGERFPTGKLFEAMRIDFLCDIERGFYVRITGREVDPSDVAWDADQAVELSRPPAPNQEVAFIGLPPPELTVSAFAVQDGDTIFPAIGVVFANPSDTRIRSGLIEIVPDGGGAIITKTIDAGPDPLTSNATAFIDGILPGVTYKVRARYQGLIKPSEWSGYYTVIATNELNVPSASSAYPGSALDDYLNAISDQLDDVLGPGPYDDCFPFWQVGGPGDIGDVEANVNNPSDLKVNAGYISHISLGEVLIDETIVDTPWGVYYAPPFGVGGLAWSQEPVASRFSNGAGNGHLFSFAYDADGITVRAYGLDRNAGEVFVPEPTDAVLALFHKPLQDGSDDLSSADAITYVDTLIRVDAVMASKISVVEASAADSAAAVTTVTIALANEVLTRASETTTLTANLATANANISTNTTAIATETAARASADSTLTANLATANANITSNTTAIATEAAARASADTTLTTNLGIANASITSNATAISTEAASRASADSTLTANLGTLSGTVSTQASTIAGLDGRVSSYYGIKVAAGTNYATVELMASGGGVPSTVVINAGQILLNGATIINGSVTASKLAVTSLDAITGTIGLLRTASSGARMELESNQGRVYDSGGTMRVRWGIW